MIQSKNRKYWVLILTGSIAFLALLLFLIQIKLAGDRSASLDFPWHSFIRSISLSFPFLIAIIYADYKIVQFVNNNGWLSSHLFTRIVLEALFIIALALLFILVGNIPYYYGSSLHFFFNDLIYKGSIVAGILLNLFIVVIIEFFAQHRKSLALQEENSRMQYQQLKSQINPHFLFNSLSVLTSLINRDAERATDYTKKLSDVYRYVLTHDSENLISVSEELMFIQNYMEILQIRFGEGLQMRCEVEAADMKKSIPPMALQVLVENAVKHNALSPSDRLYIQIKSDGKHILVSNNIIPRLRVAACTGIGLDNLQAKYQIIASESIRIEKTENTFIVKLPLL